ncbi:MAG: cytochrome c peroxidase [Saprospiraceae bacterium]
MKKIYLSLVAVFLLVVLTSMTPLGKKMISAINYSSATFSNQVLDLPDVMLDYEIADLPDFIQNAPNPWGGGGGGNTLSLVTNEGSTLGRVLFYDKKLSLDGTVSCASCHKQELSFADDVALSEGIMETKTTRNSLHINDIAWQNSNELFWDGRQSVLEEMVIQPIIDPNELGLDIVELIQIMEGTDYYSDLFTEAFGTPAITEERIGDALAQFVRSYTSFESKFDQGLQNGFADFTSSEHEGMDLFEAQCGICHATPHFGASTFSSMLNGGNFTNGLDSVAADPGMGGWTNDPFFDGVFKTPTLRNIEVTGPYMHDGRFETLEEVVDFYSEGLQSHPNSFFNWMSDPTGLDFSDEEKLNLVNFMKTLTDDNYLTNEKWSNPFIEEAPNAVQDPHLFEDITVFPNPAVDFTYININNSENKTYDIRLSTMSGKQLQSTSFEGSQYVLNTSNLPVGIYMIQIRQGDTQRAIKLAIHK